MGMAQQSFVSPVMSVLILEDIMAIVMMVMLSTIAGGKDLTGSQILGSVGRIGFFLVLWFVIGLFAIPLILRSVRRFLNSETLLIVALGLCCLMAVISTQVGFSAAFGAFVMGSILAETVEADKIERVVEPVKNLFGAIFFVSVGMLVEPKILVEYAIPILLLTLTIIIGHVLFSTVGFFLGGVQLKNAMRCSFSMVQIGEFAFIIATLGLSLHVINDYLYPVVVAVSVITTFLTPYVMRMADPAYNLFTRAIPKHWARRLEHMQAGTPEDAISESSWRSLIKAMLLNTIIYGILSSAVIVIMFSLALPFCRQQSIALTGEHWAGNAVCGVLTVMFISPFLRSIVMKKNHSEEFKTLWTRSLLNRIPLVATIVLRIIVAAAFVFYVCNYLTRLRSAFMITVALVVITLMILSRNLKQRSIRLERLFIENLRSRDIKAQVEGRRKPLFAENLLDRDIHIGNVEVPEGSLWAGKSLRSLKLRNRFGVHVSSILRGNQRLNIPGGNTILFPGDKIQAIGDDEQLSNFSAAVKAELYKEDLEIEQREMKLRQVVLKKQSEFIGKTIRESGIRDHYNCMVVGIDSGQQNLTLIDPAHVLENGDVLWLVGEEHDLRVIMELV